ncbi:MAG: diphthine--ammonia ligase [Cellulophaga sp.]
MQKAYFNWSSGKDSTLALYKVLQEKEYSVEQLVTAVNNDFNRVSMHGLRASLLEEQVKSIGLPLYEIELSGDISMQTYDSRMRLETEKLLKQGFKYAIFGDIFLEDLRLYREEKLLEVGINAVFPLWKQDTKALLLEFLSLGFKAITVCVNAKFLDESFVGREVNEQFLADLPENVDPCGENGEYHTFVYDGPIFKYPILFEIGEKVKRGYEPSKDGNDCYKKKPTWDFSFWYCDLLPIDTEKFKI